MTRVEHLWSDVPKDDGEWGLIIALYHETRVDVTMKERRVRMGGRRPTLIPARCIKIVQGTTRRADPGKSYSAVIEKYDAGLFPLPNGLMVGASYANVDSRVTVQIQLADFGNEDVYIKPRTPLGILQPASVDDKTSLQQVGEANVRVEEIITHAGKTTVKDLISKMSIGYIDSKQRT